MDYRRLHTIGRGISDAVLAGAIHPSTPDATRARLSITDAGRVVPYVPPAQRRRIPRVKPGACTLPPLESAL